VTGTRKSNKKNIETRKVAGYLWTFQFATKLGGVYFMDWTIRPEFSF